LSLFIVESYGSTNTVWEKYKISVKLSGTYCNQEHVNRKDIRSSGILRRTDVSEQQNFPMNMETIGCPEMSATT
jgi:hypothetical protein